MKKQKSIHASVGVLGFPVFPPFSSPHFLGPHFLLHSGWELSLGIFGVWLLFLFFFVSFNVQHLHGTEWAA